MKYSSNINELLRDCKPSSLNVTDAAYLSGVKLTTIYAYLYSNQTPGFLKAIALFDAFGTPIDKVSKSVVLFKRNVKRSDGPKKGKEPNPPRDIKIIRTAFKNSSKRNQR